jgi:peptidoglycan hydrolase-like protein with peptidoglycan-binding domain
MPDFETPPTIGQGDSGGNVTLLQQFLIALELDPGPQPDGSFGDTTASEVADFKSSHGLPEDSTVDADTWAALFEAVGPLPTDSMPTFNLDDFPAIAQVLTFAQSSDVDGYVAATLDDEG